MKTIGINRITPSGLVEYENCPLLFYYRTWLGLKLPQPQVHLKFGSAIHAAIEIIFKERNVQKACDLFSNEFLLEHLDDYEIKGQPATEAERIAKYGDMLHDGKEMLNSLNQEVDTFKSLHNIKPIQFELAWKEILTHPETNLEPLEIPLSCRIDCLCEDDVILEFKTSSQEYDIFETRASPQALSYAWIYYQKYKKIPIIHYIVLRKNRKKDRINHLRIQYDFADLLAFDSKVRSILEKIRNREFNRPIKGHPMFCDCKKFEEALKIN